jgi:hypothetical protein
MLECNWLVTLSLVTHTLTRNWLSPHCSLNSVRCSLFRLGTDNIENTLLLGNRYQVLLSGVSTYALPSNRRPTVAWRHSLARRGVYRALRNDGRCGGMWRHSRERRVHVTPTSCCTPSTSQYFNIKLQNVWQWLWYLCLEENVFSS